MTVDQTITKSISTRRNFRSEFATNSPIISLIGNPP